MLFFFFCRIRISIITLSILLLQHCSYGQVTFTRDWSGKRSNIYDNPIIEKGLQKPATTMDFCTNFTVNNFINILFYEYTYTGFKYCSMTSSNNVKKMTISQYTCS